MDFSSGVFLVRYSENSGDDVLTLLFDYKPKHFIIQKYVRLCYKLQNFIIKAMIVADVIFIH